MKIGVADFGLNVYEGGLFDLEGRLLKLKEIGYDGIERLEADSPSQALERAAIFTRLGMDFGTVRATSFGSSLQWTAGFRKEYIWTAASARDMDAFCRQVNFQCQATAKMNVRTVLHNHLGTVVETQEQLDHFMAACPECGLLLDTAHLAAAGGDPVGTAKKYAQRIIAVHVKDWFAYEPEETIKEWHRKGRFCELGAGNIGLDNHAVLDVLKSSGYDGWIFVEQDTHLRNPYGDLAVSRRYLRDSGI